MTVQLIAIEEIKQDPLLQPRAHIDESTVGEYAEAMENGDKFPPVDVFFFDSQYYLADGFHRVKAAQQKSWKEIPCHVHIGNIREAILFASGANASHGIRRTNEDKRRVVTRMLNDPEWGGWSSGQIGRICNVSDEFVRKLKHATPNVGGEKNQNTVTYTHKSGKQSSMDIAHHGKNHAPVQPELVPVTRDATVAEPLNKNETIVLQNQTAPKNNVLQPIPQIPSVLPSSIDDECKISASLQVIKEQYAKELVAVLSDDDRADLNKIIAAKNLPGYFSAIHLVIVWARREVARL
jgi:hypothetical protein